MDCYRSFIVVTLAISLGSLSSPYSNAAQLRRLTSEAIVAMRSLQGLAVSPSGNAVVYVVNEPFPDSQSKEPTNTELWFASIDGKIQRRLTDSPGADMSPTWDPKGRTVAFLSARSGKSGNQIFSVDPGSGEVHQLTHHETGVSSFVWSPDGQRIAYLAQEPLDSSEKARREIGDDEMVFTLSDDLQHLTPQKLWLLDLGTHKATLVPTEHYHVSSLSWSPDGRQIALIVSDEANMDHEWTRSKVAVVPVSGGQPKIYCPTHGRVQKLKWKPDSSGVSFLMSSADGHEAAASSLYVCSQPGTDAVNLAVDAAFTVQGYSWLPNNTTLILSIVEKNSRKLVRFDANTRTLTQISKPGQVVSTDPSLSSDAEILAIAVETPSRPSDVWIGSTRGLQRQITRLNPYLEEFTYGETEEVEWKASDGLTIGGVLVKPVGYEAGMRYPLITQVHGGPESVELNGFQISWAQFFAANGYAVFLPNFRGSVGRGVNFTVINNRDFGGMDFQDILSGIDFLIEKGIADPNKLGIGGWSYGGFMSAWAVTQTQRFKAAVVGVGVSNWFSLMGQTPVPLWTVQVHFEEWPADNPKAFRKNSPIEFVRNVQTPTLWLHGEVDPMIALSQAREFFRALQHQKVPSELVVFPREGHGLREPVHRKSAYARILKWYDRYVKSVRN